MKRAVAIAREAMEEDAAEARKRGWGIPAPDAVSVATLAAGLLVADAIKAAEEAQRPPARAVSGRARTSRTAAERAAKTPPVGAAQRP